MMKYFVQNKPQDNDAIAAYMFQSVCLILFLFERTFCVCQESVCAYMVMFIRLYLLCTDSSKLVRRGVPYIMCLLWYLAKEQLVRLKFAFICAFVHRPVSLHAYVIISA